LEGINIQGYLDSGKYEKVDERTVRQRADSLKELVR